MKKNILIVLLIWGAPYTFSQALIDVNIDANIYESPDFNSIVLTRVYEGSSVMANALVRTPNVWDVFFRVSYSGVDGWIYKTHLAYNDRYYSALNKIVTIQNYVSPKSITQKSDSLNSSFNPLSNSKPATKPILKTSIYNPYAIKVINLTKRSSGTFTIPCQLNGVKMDFIFDTGASDVSISLTEAMFMIKNGYLNESDIFGTEYYKIANGEIQEGTKIVIRELEFDGLKLFNVEASVVHNLDAPLLLGQSAISQLGKIQIDYNKNTLTVIK